MAGTPGANAGNTKESAGYETTLTKEINAKRPGYQSGPLTLTAPLQPWHTILLSLMANKKEQ
jgi:hypothetical protein